MLMDRTTEAIAHFIGLFAITVEEAQQRDLFKEFAVANGKWDAPAPLPDTQLSFSADYVLEGYDPGLIYRAPAPDIVPWTTWSSVHLAPIGAEVGAGSAAVPRPSAQSEPLLKSSTTQDATPFEIEPPGSVANYIHQGISLSDDDYFGVGGHGLKFTPEPVGDAAVIDLFGTADALSPIPDGDAPGDAAALVEFIEATADAIEAYDPQLSLGGMADEDVESLFVAKEPSIDGTFVNGEVGEAPELEDYFSLEERYSSGAHSDEPLASNATVTEDGVQTDASVTAETGSNTLINDAVLKNVWTGATVTAVVGDYVEINAVVQINAWWDSDAVTDAISDWDEAPSATEAFNIATFETTETTAEDTATEDSAAADDFPKDWVVTKVEGDLLIVNWLQQLTFMSDDDTGVLSASGATSYVYSGSNGAYNEISLYELGLEYDLIVIGGSVYDVNIILQTNILADSDLIGAVSDFETSGSGTYSTSGNLLWNEAAIYNIGSDGAYESLSADYQETASALADGSEEISEGVLTDSAFADDTTLSVLYIEGDLINLQYVEQTNILGDNDQIALALSESGAYADAEWSVSTGNNALLNNAVIVDLDSIGKTYVGGEQYSQDLLVQADIISTDPAYGGQDPDVLVNEAIAFLDDSTNASDDGQLYAAGSLDADSANGDALHSLIG